jgi:hypothetical protein
MAATSDMVQMVDTKDLPRRQNICVATCSRLSRAVLRGASSHESQGSLRHVHVLITIANSVHGEQVANLRRLLRSHLCAAEPIVSLQMACDRFVLQSELER